MYVYRNIEAGLCNHCCRGKAVSIIYSKRASAALVIQHAKRMRHIIVSSMTCLNLPYYIYIYIHEGWNFNSGNYLFTTDTK